MKVLALTLLEFILVLMVNNSCKKDPIIEPTQDIAGHWQWLSSWYVRANERF